MKRVRLKKPKASSEEIITLPLTLCNQILDYLEYIAVIKPGTRARTDMLILHINTSSEQYKITEEGVENKIKSFNLDPPITFALFETFWRLYPKKVDKGKAKRYWEKMCGFPKNKKPTWNTIQKALIKQKKSERWVQQPKYIPAPYSWLYKYRWIDDPNEMKVWSKDVDDDIRKSKWDDGREYKWQPDGTYRNAAGDRWVD